jgi:hypothetical protein
VQTNVVGMNWIGLNLLKWWALRLLSVLIPINWLINQLSVE